MFVFLVFPLSTCTYLSQTHLSLLSVDYGKISVCAVLYFSLKEGPLFKEYCDGRVAPALNILLQPNLNLQGLWTAVKIDFTKLWGYFKVHDMSFRSSWVLSNFIACCLPATVARWCLPK